MSQPIEPKPATEVKPATGADGSQEETADDEDDDFSGGFDETKARAAIAKKNREAKNLRDRLKSVEPMLAEFTQWKEAQKTQAQKDAELREAQMVELNSTKEMLARQTACLKAGFTADEIVEFAPRLRGADEDALVEDAKKLKERLSPTTGRRADNSQGRGTPTAASPAAAFAQLIGKKD